MANLNQQMGYSAPNDMMRMPVQFPYAYNNLISNSPYDNYMGKPIQQNPNNQFLKCRPVSSKDEARAFQIDLDGSLWVFTDIGNQKIYTKQTNIDGTATFKTYILEDENLSSSQQYITREEFNKAMQTIMAAMQQQNATVLNDNKQEKTTPIIFN